MSNTRRVLCQDTMIPIISPGLIFVLFSKGLIIRGNFAFQNVLTIKTA